MPISVTPAGITAFVIPVLPKANRSSVVTPSGITSSPVRFAQLANALSPMVFNVLGNTMDLMSLRFLYAPVPIAVTPSGIVSLPLSSTTVALESTLMISLPVSVLLTIVPFSNA